MTFLTTLAPFDFRGDVDQMALLKTLPTPAWRLALGEVLAPVLIFTLIQWAALAAMAGFSDRPEPLLPVAPPSPRCTISCFSGSTICCFCCSRRG